MTWNKPCHWDVDWHKKFWYLQIRSSGRTLLATPCTNSLVLRVTVVLLLRGMPLSKRAAAAASTRGFSTTLIRASSVRTLFANLATMDRLELQEDQPKGKEVFRYGACERQNQRTCWDRCGCYGGKIVLFLLFVVFAAAAVRWDRKRVMRRQNRKTTRQWIKPYS